jgi:phosphinothricin acetyltransferase
MTETVLRPAAIDDLARLTEIYNHYITETAITFDTVPFTPDGRREWFNRYSASGRHRLIVAECDGTVAGYTTSSRYSDRAAYDTTVETTILCAPEFVGLGVGRLLYTALFAALEAEDVHTAVARISLPNRGSCDLHEALGFRQLGVMKEAGRKFGRYWDVAYYQKMMGDGALERSR